MDNHLPARFLQHLQQEKGYSRHTLTAYRSDLRSLEEFLCKHYELSLSNSAEVPNITPRMIRAWAADLMEGQHLKAKSISRKLSSAKSFFKFLQQEIGLSTNPAAVIKLPRQPHTLPTYLREQETEWLFEENLFEDSFEGARDRAILELFYASGLRRAELIQLKPSDIDWDSRMLKVTGKGNKQRLVPFGQAAKEAMQAYQQQKSPLSGVNSHSHFFVKKDGQPLYP
ncbi:MAG: tyrosine-type recombinase/integrase, partial [Bacteroidota bacterium]